MTQTLWKVACGPECGFLIRSHEKKEVVASTIGHMKGSHGKTMSETEARAAMEKVVA